ncbi:MAG: PAS domain S-box protein, partial [Chthoniobacterales bacterium]
IDNIPDLIFFKDKNSIFLGCNKAFEKQLGISEKELIGKTDHDIVTGEIAEHYRIKDKEMLATGQSLRAEEWIPSKNGEGGHYETIKTPFFGAQGEALGLIGVSRDITERKQAHQRLTLLDTCIANLNEIILVTEATPLDEPGPAIVYANKAFERITGYTEEEVMGRNPRFLQGPKTDRRVLDEIREALAKQQPIRRQLLNYGKDGTEYWLDIDIVPIFDDSGKCTHFAAIERDITEEKEAGAQILLKTTFFECLANSALDGILIVDGNGMKVVENQQMIDMWEIPPDVAAEDDINKQLQWALGQIKNLQVIEEQFDYISAHPDEISRDEIELINGKIFDRYSSPVQDKQGNCFGRIWKFRDITEARVREKRLADALVREQGLSREAKAGNRAKSEFLAVMSHEIRTPMNAILGFAELLALTPDLPTDCCDYVETITSSGEALLRILNDILDYSRLEANGMQIEKKSFSPREVLQDIHTLLAPHACEKGLAFQLSFEKEMPKWLLGDAGRLRQVLVNLTSNAIKFTERGSVILGLRMTGKSLDEKPQNTEFFVQDTGSGIPEGRIEDIFKPFTQLDSGTSRARGGTGLGLSISRNLVKLMEGTLSVNNRPEGGSEFKVTLPYIVSDGEAVHTPEASYGKLDETFALRNPLRVLLVEDDTINRKLMMIMLRKLGYEMLFAENGIKALEIYRKEQPDCILMDLQMPEKDGFEAAVEIRKMEQDAATGTHAFISALTANTGAEDRKRCFDVGMDAYLSKPINRTQLAETLVQASDRKKV